LLSLQRIAIIQQQRAKWHDNLSKKKTFQKGDWALLYDSRFQDFLGKLQTRWLSPYEIQEVHNNGTLSLTTIDGSNHSFKVNGHRVHLYHQPLIKQYFYEQVCEDPSMQILATGNENPIDFPSKN